MAKGNRYSKKHKLNKSQHKPTYNRESFKHDLTGSTGQSGIVRTDGAFAQDEILRNLQFPQGMYVYREMRDNSPIIGAMMFAINSIIKTVTFESKAADESPKAQEYASHLQSCLGDMEKPFPKYISEFFTMLVFGFSLNAIEFKKRIGQGYEPEFESKYGDGKWGFRGFPTRAQETITGWRYLDENNPSRVTHAVQQNIEGRTLDSYDLDLNKCLHFRVDTNKDNPESRSILRNAYLPWFYVKHYERDQALRISHDARGLPIFYMPAQAMGSAALPGEKQLSNSINSMIRNLHDGKQKGIKLPSDRDQMGNKLYEVEYLNRDSNGTYDVEAIIQRHSKEMLQTVLADFIEMGNTSVGSFALSSNKTKMFSVAVSGWLDEIVHGFQKAIKQLGVLEGWDPALLPTLTYSDIESVDLDVYGTFLEKMAKAGIIIPDDLLEEAVRKESGLPASSTGSRDVGMIKNVKEKAAKEAEAAAKKEESIKVAAKSTAKPSSASNLK